jgi:hypothetical protein
METETPVMLLFVCNRTDQEIIFSDTKQILETALEDIKENGMMPEEFKNKEMLHFMLRLNALCHLAVDKPTNNKAYDPYKEQGKKAFRFQVAKEDVNYFKYISSHAHKLRLEIKYLEITGTLGNNALMSNCTHLCQCIQGHLNFHLTVTAMDGRDRPLLN